MTVRKRWLKMGGCWIDGQERQRLATYYDWSGRQGLANRHNPPPHQSHWTLPQEREAVLTYAREHPGEGYRRLTYMMIDVDVAYLSPAVSHIKVGIVLSKQGDLPGALRAYRESLPVVERLAEGDPSNAGWQRDLVVGYKRMANMATKNGRGDAKAWWRKAYDQLAGMQQRGIMLPKDERIWRRSGRRRGCERRQAICRCAASARLRKPAPAP